jgi:RNA polymerase sigma-70 factor (ECF subfamily)
VATISPEPGDLVLPLAPAQQSGGTSSEILTRSEISFSLVKELWVAANAESCGLTLEEFSTTLDRVGTKFNHGFPAGTHPDASQKAAFFRALHIADLALASSCALGREAGWQQFLSLYRAPLTRAAIAITGSETVGRDLADSLYSELYGLRELDGERRSPLTSYSGRGSLLGWLRTTLAQRHVDHYRRTHREISLDNLDASAPEPAASPVPHELEQLADALTRTLQGLSPEDRFLLASYFLDRRTLLEIARTLHVHEATISRRLKRLVRDLREKLLENLQAGGLSRQAAENALGTDPRDLDISLETNLRTLLQTSQTGAFSDLKPASTTPRMGQS